MKRIIVSLFFATIMMSSVPKAMGSSVGNHLVSTTSSSSNHALTFQEAEQLTARLKEIHKLSKTNLNNDQKQELRKEVLSIKERLTDPVGGGIYISAGALILIVILLIILL